MFSLALDRIERIEASGGSSYDKWQTSGIILVDRIAPLRVVLLGMTESAPDAGDLALDAANAGAVVPMHARKLSCASGIDQKPFRGVVVCRRLDE